MSKLELDHFFCFCSPDLPEADIASENGFNVTPKLSHPGQGTANRALIFEDNYLEFIYLESLADAEKNRLRLDKRAHWKQSGASPYGIGLRGTLSEEDKKQFWAYQPPYRPAVTIYIHKGNEDSPEQPFLFFMTADFFTSAETMAPKFWEKLDKNLLVHKTGTTQIKSVELSGPSYRWPLSSVAPGIDYKISSTNKARVNIDGNFSKSVNFNEILTVVGSH